MQRVVTERCGARDGRAGHVARRPPPPKAVAAGLRARAWSDVTPGSLPRYRLEEVGSVAVFDALCHLPLFISPDDARAFLEQARTHGVTDVMCAGTDPTRVELAYTIEGVRMHRAYGVHPEHARDDARDAQLAALRAKQGHVAIGECGMDSRDGHPPLEEQERTLRAQLAIAREQKFPVILHLVGAWSRAMDVLDDDVAQHGPLPRGGVWHAFAGPKEAIARAEKHNLALSIGGLVLNPHARRLHDALPFIAAEMLVVESDMPHEPPVRLRDVVLQVAAVLGVPHDDVARRTSENARRIFSEGAPGLVPGEREASSE